jgi:hypothetical protein
VVTSPDEPGLSVEVDAVTGRWQAVETKRAPDKGDYLLVSESREPERYRADIFEDGAREDSPLFSLCPDREPGRYWGFALDDQEPRGELLFHLSITGERAELHWLDPDKTIALLDAAGLAYDKRVSSGFPSWTRVRIYAPRNALLDALRSAGDGILASEPTLFQRVAGAD